MRIIAIIARIIFIACLPLLFLTASIGLAFNSVSLYRYGFEKYNISQVTGLSRPELEKTARGLISYFNSPEEYINLSVEKNGQSFVLFNQREVLHLKDVKELVWLDYRVLAGTLIFVLGYAGFNLFWRRGKNIREMLKAVFAGSGLTLALVVALVTGALINEESFAHFFLQFHLLAFANDLWILDPTKDYLIMLFPEGFWYDVTAFLVAVMAGLALLVGSVALSSLWITRQPQTSE